MWQKTAGYTAFLLFLHALAATPANAEWAGRSDGTVFDSETGLIWMRCAVGQTWTGTTCLGDATSHTWAEATSLNISYAGWNDWRLPTIRELQSLVLYWNASPAIDSASAFLATPSTAFWSATTSQWDSAQAWYVDFDSGETSFASKSPVSWPGFSYTWATRLVRGGLASPRLNPARPDADFTDLGQGMVKHLPTGLIWQRCAKGQTWSANQCTGTAQTFTRDQTIAITDTLGGYADWRLPEPDELLSLVDYQTTSPAPAINVNWFPNVANIANQRSFWTSMRYRSLFTGQTWTVNFSSGASGGVDDDTTGALQVRLVRKEWTSYGTLNVATAGNGTGTVVSNPWGIDCGTSCTSEFLMGSWVLLSPVASSGSHFSGWSGDCTGSGPCQLEMNATTRAVTANFASDSPPGPPNITAANTGAGSITLIFSVPLETGGSAITQYTVTCSSPGHPARTQTATRSPITVRGLTGGVNYTCSVTATNASGIGQAAVWPNMLRPRSGGLAGVLMLLLD